MKEVIVFTKVPERGQVKTRLQRKYPAHTVEEIYVAFLQDTLEKLRPYYPWVAYFPEGKVQVLWNLLGDRKYLLQRGRDFGEKVMSVFGDFYKMGVKNVVVVNCDVPTLRKEHVDQAFQLMESCDAVLGPAHDGGFYLIGGRNVRKELFEGVEWDGQYVLERIKRNAEGGGLKLAYTPELRDVDTPEDLEAVRSSGELDKESLTFKTLKKIR
ncbi:MAG: TIGR04282 family arsenosugar biosynthesis glycosyltransferase [Candidatus Altiarchaeota archaeon]